MHKIKDNTPIKQTFGIDVERQKYINGEFCKQLTIHTLGSFESIRKEHGDNFILNILKFKMS